MQEAMKKFQRKPSSKPVPASKPKKMQIASPKYQSDVPVETDAEEVIAEKIWGITKPLFILTFL